MWIDEGHVLYTFQWTNPTSSIQHYNLQTHKHMRKSNPEQQFKLDLTHKDSKQRSSLDILNLCSDILHYSNDDGQQQILKQLKEQQREEQMRLAKTQDFKPDANKQLKRGQEERKRDRKAIFEKYKKEQKEGEPGNEDIMRTFDEVFRANERRREIEQQLNIQMQLHMENRKIQVAEPDKMLKQKTRIFSGKAEPASDSLVIEEMDQNNKMLASVKSAVEHVELGQPTRNEQNSNSHMVYADPTESVTIPLNLINSNASPQANPIQIPSMPSNPPPLPPQSDTSANKISFSVICGSLQPQPIDLSYSKDQSKDMIGQIEAFLKQDIFADISELDTSGMGISKVGGGGQSKIGGQGEAGKAVVPEGPSAPAPLTVFQEGGVGLMGLHATMKEVRNRIEDEKQQQQAVDIVPVALMETVKRKSIIDIGNGEKIEETIVYDMTNMRGSENPQLTSISSLQIQSIYVPQPPPAQAQQIPEPQQPQQLPHPIQIPQPALQPLQISESKPIPVERPSIQSPTIERPSNIKSIANINQQLIRKLSSTDDIPPPPILTSLASSSQQNTSKPAIAQQNINQTFTNQHQQSQPIIPQQPTTPPMRQQIGSSHSTAAQIATSQPIAAQSPQSQPIVPQKNVMASLNFQNNTLSGSQPMPTHIQPQAPLQPQQQHYQSHNSKQNQYQPQLQQPHSQPLQSQQAQNQQQPQAQQPQQSASSPTPPATTPIDPLLSSQLASNITFPQASLLTTQNFATLPDPTFPQPSPNPKVCELLRQACRLNSVLLNLANPSTHIFLPRLKQMLRKTVFEMTMVAQTLWALNQQVYLRETEQKKLYIGFRPELFMGGKWCQPLTRNVNVLRGEFVQQQRRRGEYTEVQGALMNAGSVLKELSSIVETMRIDPNSQESLARYNAVKTAFDSLLNNFLRISEDLFVKATIKYVPEHYFTFYEYLKSGIYPTTDIRMLVKQRQDMLTQVLRLRQANDPLCNSLVGADLFNRLHSQIRKLKADYFSANRVGSPK